MNLVDAQDSIVDHLSRQVKLEDYIYLLIDRALSQTKIDHELQGYVAKAPGGAWNKICSISIGVDSTVLELITVKNIISRKGYKDRLVFDHCDPKFPDNLVDLLELAARNASRAFDIANRRAWDHYLRKIPKF